MLQSAAAAPFVVNIYFTINISLMFAWTWTLLHLCWIT